MKGLFNGPGHWAAHIQADTHRTLIHRDTPSRKLLSGSSGIREKQIIAVGKFRLRGNVDTSGRCVRAKNERLSRARNIQHGRLKVE